MAILTSVLGAIAALAPQQQPPQTQPHPFVQATTFPRGTLFLASWNGDASAPWQRAFEAMPREVRDVIPELLTLVSGDKTTTSSIAEASKRLRASVGFIGLTPKGDPDWLGTVTFSRVASVRAALDALEKLPESTDLTPPTGLRSVVVGSNGETITYAQHGTTLVLGGAVDSVAQALARTQGDDTTNSIEENPRFERFCEQIAKDSPRRPAFAAAFVDVSRIMELVLGAQQIAPFEEQARSTVAAMGLDQLSAVGYVAHDFEDHVVEHTRICFPEPRRGLPSLFTGTGPIDVQLARFVPDGAPSFSLFHCEADRLLEEAVVLASTIDATAGEQARGMLRASGQMLGVDIEKDIISTLGRRFMLVQWPSTGEPEVALVAAIRNPIGLAKTLRKVRQLEGSRREDFELFRPAASGGLSIAIGQGHAILTTSDKRMQAIIAQATSGALHQGVRDALTDAPKTTSAVSWTDTARMFESYLGMASMALPMQMPAELRHSLDSVLSALGETRVIVTSDLAGLSLRSESPLGAAGSILLLGGTVAASFAPEGIGAASRDAISRQADFSWRLGEIARTLATSESRDLDTLVADGALSEDILGESLGRGIWRTEGYRIQLFTDSDDSTRFVVVAWPDAERRGPVFACSNDRVPLVNSVLTHTAGIEKLSIRDVYLGGKFDGELMTGWDHVNLLGSSSTEPETASTVIAAELQGQDWADYQAIVTIERGDITVEPSVLIRHLDSDNPIVAARASRALAKLRVQDSAPEICARVLTVLDDGARRQMTKAIVEFGDPRSMATLRQLLGDPDPTIRALAATSVGGEALPADASALLDIISRKEPRSNEPDRIAALLALADLGDPRHAGAIAACPVNGALHEQALGYALQELAPKLEPDAEVALLMASLDHETRIVRRFSIQRLGELGDATAVSALERRLGEEQGELLPLVEVSLAALRGPETTPVSTDDVRTGPEEHPVLAKAKAWYYGMDPDTRKIVLAGSAGGALVLVALIIFAIRRPRRSKTDWAAMAAPSEAEDGEYAEPYDDDYVDGEYDEVYEQAEEGADEHELEPVESGFYADEYDADEYAEDLDRP